MPAAPLWRATDPLPSHDEVLNVDRKFDSIKSVPGFWDTPRGPVEPRVPAYHLERSADMTDLQWQTELRKWNNSVLHPQGEVVAAFKNYLYFNAPAWVGGRPWSRMVAEARHNKNLQRYPLAQIWFGDGFRLDAQARAAEYVPRPGSYLEFAKASEGWKVALFTSICVVAGLSLNAFLNSALGTKKAPTDTPDWHAATEKKYAKYNPDPVSKHKIGDRVSLPTM